MELDEFTESYGIALLDEAEFTFDGLKKFYSDVGMLIIYRHDDLAMVEVHPNSYINRTKLCKLFGNSEDPFF